MTDKNLAILATIATIAVAVAAGVLAAVNGHTTALATGAVSHWWLAWLVPVTIEGASLTAALLSVRRRRAGLSTWAERAALLVMLAIATVTNAAHVVSGSVLGVGIEALPPLVLLVSIELLIRASTTTTVARAKSARPKAVSEPVKARDGAKTNRALRSETEARFERAVEIVAEQPSISGGQLAERLGVSRSTGSRTLSKVRESMAA